MNQQHKINNLLINEEMRINVKYDIQSIKHWRYTIYSIYTV